MNIRAPRKNVDPQDPNKYRLLLTILAAFACFTAVFYVVIYLSTRFWQALLIAGVMFAAAAMAPLVYVLFKRGILTPPAALVLVTVGIGYGMNEVVWKGLLLNHIIGGLLLILLTASLVLPRRWGVWLFTGVLYLVFVFWVNRFEPLPRIEQAQIPVLLPYALGTNLVLGLVLIGVLLQVSVGRTLSARLIIVIAMLVTVPMMISGTVSAYANARASRESAIAKLEAAVLVKEIQIRDWVGNVEFYLSQAVLAPDESWYVEILSNSSGPEVNYVLARKLVSGHFSPLVRQNGLFETVMMTNQAGRVVFSTDEAMEGVDVSGQSYFAPGLKGFTLTSPSLVGDQQVVIYAAMPVVDQVGASVGVVVGRTRYAPLEEILQADAGLGASGETYLVSPDEVIITAATSSIPFGGIRLLPPTLQTALRNQQNGQAAYRSYRLTNVLGAYHWLPEWGVMVVAEQDAVQAYLPMVRSMALIIGVGVGVMLLAIVVAAYVSRQISRPISEFARTAREITAGNFTLTATIRPDQPQEIITLGEAFNSMTAQLSAQMAKLEERVAERTAELERRSLQLQVAAEVARDASTVQDYNVLLERAVNLVRDRFMFYHAGIFLLDEAGEYAVLRAATGEAGRQMLENDHKLQLGGVSMVGTAAATGTPRIALDVGEEAVHFRNPLLPETRSEMALPLKVGQRVIGVLDVQSQARNAFTEDDVVILQIMADQLAVAIENARLFQEVQDSLRQVEALYGQYSQKSWQKIIETNRIAGYRYEPAGSAPITEWNEGEAASPEAPNPHLVTIPLRVRGRQIGNLEVLPNPDQWSDNDLIFLSEIGDRLSQALESARLYQESQLRAASEQLIGGIAARMRATLDMDTVLQTAAREIRQALNLQEVEIHLGLVEDSQA